MTASSIISVLNLFMFLNKHVVTKSHENLIVMRDLYSKTLAETTFSHGTRNIFKIPTEKGMIEEL